MQRLCPSLVDRALALGDMGFELQVSGRADGVDSHFSPTPGAYAVHGEFGHLTMADLGGMRSVGLQPARPLAAAALLLELALWTRRR
jgi:hypothetical protein